MGPRRFELLSSAPKAEILKQVRLRALSLALIFNIFATYFPKLVNLAIEEFPKSIKPKFLSIFAFSFKVEIEIPVDFDILFNRWVTDSKEFLETSKRISI